MQVFPLGEGALRSAFLTHTGGANRYSKMTHDWKALYAAAMLETDKTQVQHRIEKADAAITARLLELPNTISASAEKMELQSALAYLCRLKGDSMVFSN